MDVDDSDDKLQDEDTIIQHENLMNDNNQDEHNNIKGFSFEMEFEIDEVHDHYVATSTQFIGDLLELWVKDNAIDGVVALDNKIIDKGLQDYQA